MALVDLRHVARQRATRLRSAFQCLQSMLKYQLHRQPVAVGTFVGEELGDAGGVKGMDA